MDYSSEDRKNLASKGKALPGGRFPIKNRTDLENAIRAVGRVKPNTDEARAKVRRFIIGRAKDLGFSNLVPYSWASDGSLK